MPYIEPYLTFTGNCREAMTFYQQILGGELTVQTFEEAPAGADNPPEYQQQIMHAILKNGNLVVMASDAGKYSKYMVQGNTVNLSLACETEAYLDEKFAQLSEGGQVTMPLAEQFWGAKFGMIKDKFGTHWMLNFDRNAKQ